MLTTVLWDLIPVLAFLTGVLWGRHATGFERDRLRWERDQLAASLLQARTGVRTIPMQVRR